MKKRIEKKYEDITYQIGFSHGCPIMEIMTAEEQKEIEEAGYNVDEIIDINISSYRDWQADC